VVVKVEFHFGELFLRVGFILTDLETDSRGVVHFYNKRGSAEQWIIEGKQAVQMTGSVATAFGRNEVWLWLSVIAYNLGNLWGDGWCCRRGSATGRSQACSSGW
jgi:Transposase DDE domain group 1